MHEVCLLIIFYFSLFLYFKLWLQSACSIPSTDFWLDLFFSSIQVSFVALSALHPLSYPVPGPLGRQPIPAFPTHCQSGSCQFSRLPLSAHSATFRATAAGSLQCLPLGFAISFLRWPQGLRGLGHFQQVSCERFSPLASSSRDSIITVVGK